MLSKQILFSAGFIIVGVLLLFIPSERFQALLPDLLTNPIPAIFQRELDVVRHEVIAPVVQLTDIIQETREEISSITNTPTENSIIQPQQESS